LLHQSPKLLGTGHRTLYPQGTDEDPASGLSRGVEAGILARLRNIAC
jgi:hypothetical protein